MFLHTYNEQNVAQFSIHIHYTIINFFSSNFWHSDSPISLLLTGLQRPISFQAIFQMKRQTWFHCYVCDDNKRFSVFHFWGLTIITCPAFSQCRTYFSCNLCPYKPKPKLIEAQIETQIEIRILEVKLEFVQFSPCILYIQFSLL